MEDYIKIYAVSGDPYDPYDTDKHLLKEHMLFTVCAESQQTFHAYQAHQYKPFMHCLHPMHWMHSMLTNTHDWHLGSVT